ncbi:hypothetical protein [Methylobacterium sp. 275MFSha3.1]|uniref:hypothetical protein n=1 Tax=Methylobacterium sp. 275MFSha3.1 TaxID=1502746 RepID=UPI001FCCE5C8|nr:hypothetical protein [Methylobacterium sp. 275MFSha3.1]
MALALLAALIAGTMCLGMVCILVPLQRPQQEIDLEPLNEDKFFDIGSSIIDLQAAR